MYAQEAKEPLRKALIQENDPFTRQAMQDALQEIAYPSTDEKNIERLLKLLRNARTTQEREAVANALGDIGRSALPALLILLHDSQSKIRHAATRAIAALSESRDADWFVRAYRDQVQGPLLQALSDPASSVRAGTAQALEQWGDIQAVEPLLATIQDASTKVRRAVVAALHNLKDNRALEFLLAAFFNDSDMQVRFHAAEALGRYTEDSRALNVLLQALHSQQSDKRQQAAEMFCWLKDERATDALIQALQDSSPEVREWSIEALWELCLSKNDDLSPQTIEKIREATIQARKDTHPAVKECAAKLAAWLD